MRVCVGWGAGGQVSGVDGVRLFDKVTPNKGRPEG